MLAKTNAAAAHGADGPTIEPEIDTDKLSMSQMAMSIKMVII